MKKKNLFVVLLAVIAMAGQAQTKSTATIKGYSPALKDSTLAVCIIENEGVASDMVRNGSFTLNVPVEKLTQSRIFLKGEGCPNYLLYLYLMPNVTVNLTGNDCLFPLWKVDSPVPEQQTQNRIVEHTSKTLKEDLLLQFADWPQEKSDSLFAETMKQTIDILPSLPVDAASLGALELVARMKDDIKDSSYILKLKDLEATTATRAPKGFEEELTLIHSFIYPAHVQQIGEEFIDAELFDMQGNKHHLSEAFADGRYVLFEFWSIDCGHAERARSEMQKVYEQMKDKLEIIGINLDKPSAWQNDDWSKKIVWKNWSDGKIGKGGIEALYCDELIIPYYVLISPEGRLLWKQGGYSQGSLIKMTETLIAPQH